MISNRACDVVGSSMGAVTRPKKALAARTFLMGSDGAVLRRSSSIALRQRTRLNAIRVAAV